MENSGHMNHEAGELTTYTASELHDTHDLTEKSANPDCPADPINLAPQSLSLETSQTNKQRSEDLIESFRSFVDRQDSTETDPTEIDLFSLFSELAELKNELKLNGRQVNKTLEEYREILSILKSSHTTLEVQFTQQQETFRQTLEQERKALGLELIIFCDYLELSLQSLTEKRPARWRAWFSSHTRFINRVIEGQKLLISRYQRLLDALQIKPMQLIGQPLDPSSMRVVATVNQKKQPHGMVIAEQKKGYFIGHKILRLAEVIVNKKTLEKL